MEIKNKILDYIKENNLINDGDSLILAVSGGADSVCMLDVLNELKDELSISLVIAHLNHQLRGNESLRDENFVRALCKDYNLPFFSKSVDVNALSRKLKLSCEEAGRKARYDFFNSLKKEINATKIATAHNKNDNAETVLMRFLRGTDIKGLSGIPIFNNADIVRPILCLERSEIENYLACKGLDFVTDSTNLENEFLRNKIRNNLIPEIKKEYNPNFIDTLSSNIALYSEAEIFINNVVEEKFNLLSNKESFGISFDLNTLLNQDKYIVKRLIKKTVFELCGLSLSNNNTTLICNSLNNNSRISLNEKLDFFVKYGIVYFVIKNDFSEFSCNLEQEGAIFIPELSLKVEIKKGINAPKKYDKNTIYLSKEKINSLNFVLRNKKDGDFMNLLNCGKKKIKDIFVDEKIPVFLRNTIPVLEHNNEIIWLCGVRDNGFFRAKPGEEYINITIHKEKEHEQ